jgi:hypothetical protein
MFEFIVLVASFTLAILLASFIACVIVMSKPVMKWYMRRMYKMTNDIMESLEEDQAFNRD